MLDGRDPLRSASPRSAGRRLAAQPAAERERVTRGRRAGQRRCRGRRQGGNGKGKGKNDGGKDDDNDVEGDKRKGKRRKKQCKKKKARACNSRCGIVTVKCKKGNGKSKKSQVDCGSCACDPPCEACFICDEATTTCVVDPEQQGDPCGSSGQVCQADGTCACDADTCFDGESCQPGNTPAACGTGGEACAVCSGTAGLCIDGACVGCSIINSCPDGQVCCTLECFVGVCCASGDCVPAGNNCVDHQCQCGDGAPCSGSTPDCCGNPDACTNLQTDVNNCGFCGNVCSGGTPNCEAGFCVAPCGDVCASGCPFDTVQEAIDDADPLATIDICAGAFVGDITINKSLTLRGAGQGNTPVNDTILQGGGTGSAVIVTAGANAILQNLRVTGGGGATDGGGIHNFGTLTLINSTVAGNTPTGNGGGIYNDGSLFVNGSTVSDNTAAEGGGIFNAPGGNLITIDAGSIVTDNEATDGLGFGGGIFNLSTVTCAAPGTVTGNIQDDCIDDGSGTGCDGCNPP